MDIEIPVSVARRGIESVLMAASEDATRPHLAGLMVRWDGDRVNFTATNGHWAAAFCHQEPDAAWEPGEVHLSRDCASRLAKELKWMSRKWRMEVHGEKLGIDLESHTYRLRIGTLDLELVDETQPSLTQILPEKLPEERALGIYCLQPLYLKKVSEAFGKAAEEEAVGIRFESIGKSAYDPIIVTCSTVPELTVVLMGMKMNPGEDEPSESARPKLLIG